jgi:hypothetical protein
MVDSTDPAGGESFPITGFFNSLLGLNVLGSLIYSLTGTSKYQDFRTKQMGGFVRPKKNEGLSCYRATSSELNAVKCL